MNIDPIALAQLKAQADQLTALATQLTSATAAINAHAIAQRLKIAPPLSMRVNVETSRAWTVPANGILVIRALGAGGGGAKGVAGGYSGAWGIKSLRVTKGSLVQINIGAGGAGATVGDGQPGGNTSVTVGGQTYTAYGGPGGKNTSNPLPNGPLPSANFDAGAASVKPNLGAVNASSGGAGVDIMGLGGNATTSTGMGGGGTGGPSSGTTGGPAATTNPDDWGLSIYGAGGSSGSSGAGPGGGGAGSNTGTAANGGIGGGGGGGPSSGANGGGNGGNGYVHLQFFADME